MSVGRIKMGSIETFCLLRYWNIDKPKFIKILNHNFMLNWFKWFDKKIRHFFLLKVFQYPQTKICSRGWSVSKLPICKLASLAFLIKKIKSLRARADQEQLFVCIHQKSQNLTLLYDFFSLTLFYLTKKERKVLYLALISTSHMIYPSSMIVSL